METLLSLFCRSPWKALNQVLSWALVPVVHLTFLLNGVSCGPRSRIYGRPCVLKTRGSSIRFGSDLQLRSTVLSNPLAPNHRVAICTWDAVARLEVGNGFAMTGGSLVCATSITIGDRVLVGANCDIIDTDFHPLLPEARNAGLPASKAPIVIESDVFIGANCIVLKGVTIGRGSVIGAGSVVTMNIPAGVIAAGNPARVIRSLSA